MKADSIVVVSDAADAPLKTTDCYYHTWESIGSVNFVAELTPHPAETCDVLPERVQSLEKPIFDGFGWTRWTSNHWWIPLLACAVYIPMVFVVPRIMAKREKIRVQNLVIAWNFSLSLFSFCGLWYCVPQLLVGETAGLLTNGFYQSVCTHASSYGFGMPGFFVCLFIYSKLAELLDTAFLLMRKSPVILLHWYHHVTVLLYCWHAYSVRIGTGLWFASMNYTVHAIMYFYFGLTQTGTRGRRFAKRFAMLITSMQLLQMVVGIIVTVASVVYHARGYTCHVSLVNSAFGLLMYSSYFVLFLQLFLNHYVFSRQAAKLKLPGNSDGDLPSTMQSAADATMKAHPVDSDAGGLKSSFKTT